MFRYKMFTCCEYYPVLFSFALLLTRIVRFGSCRRTSAERSRCRQEKQRQKNPPTPGMPHKRRRSVSFCIPGSPGRGGHPRLNHNISRAGSSRARSSAVAAARNNMHQPLVWSNCCRFSKDSERRTAISTVIFPSLRYTVSIPLSYSRSHRPYNTLCR